jgi:hypothetical protein
MLQMPQRSVTRFFIPMIDVLTLLFCIYLLMPVVKPGEAGDTKGDGKEPADVPPRTPEKLREEIKRLEEEKIKVLQRLKAEKLKVLQQRLLVRVLEIDGNTGKLYYRDPRDPKLIEVRNKEDAGRLIDQDREAGGGRELYYLVLYPRDRTSLYPLREQRARYDEWFAGVALGYDVPGRLAGG